MNLLPLLLTLVVVGVLLWLINNRIPMDGTIRMLINAIVIIVTMIWLLQSTGLIGSLRDVRIR